MKPPPRLLEDPSAAPELRADLERAAAAPFPYDAAAGLAGLQAVIGSIASGAAAQAGAAEAASASVAPPAAKLAVLGAAGAKLGLVAAGAAVVAASVALWPTPPQPTRTEPAPGVAAPQAPAPAPRVQAPTETARQAVPALAEPLATRAEPEHAPRAVRDPDAAMRLEIAELGRIRALLTSDPEQAYRLANAGHRRFGRGMLRQEREGLAILALWKIDRRGDAVRRTELFLERYPRSPLRAELERELQLEQRIHGESE